MQCDRDNGSFEQSCHVFCEQPPPDALSPRMVRIIEGLASDLRVLDKRIQGLSGEIEELAKRDAGCERLMTAPEHRTNHFQRHGRGDRDW